MAGADEPKPAILGRTEHDIAVAEQAESRGDMAGAKHRDVAADQHCRSRRARPECALHSGSEIAAALPDRFDPSAPMSSTVTSSIRRHRDPQAPTPVRRQAAKHQRDHRSFEMHRRNIADLTREPSLADPKAWCPHEQNDMAPHQP
jgi:hypothetical protein